MKHLGWIISTALLALTLVACGGGEDGGDGGGSGGGGSGITVCVPTGSQVPLPSDITSLDSNFDVELVATLTASYSRPDSPAKMDMAPDGRLFVSTLGGTIYTIGPKPTYAQNTWASLTVLAGSEQGLLGIAVSPNFASNGYVYVMACVTTMSGDVQRIYRFEDSSGVGINMTQIGPDLPTANTHNGGGIAFLNDGTLVVSVGDVQNSANSQTNGVLAGRILRMNENGAVPSNNPYSSPDEYEYCRGLRNSFGLTVHRGSGILVGTENGPNSNDELNYLVAGKNYEWMGASVPGGQIGVKIQNWGTVIVPTGLTYHTGNMFPAGYDDSLFICSYEDDEILRYVMDGSPPVNVFTSGAFMTFAPNAQDNKPLDIIQGIDDSLYISTFTDIWRVYCRGHP